MNCCEFEHALEADIYDSLLAEHGAYKLAKMIDRLPSYKVFNGKYPRDKYGEMVSLDTMIENGTAPASEDDSLSDLVQSVQLLAEYRLMLTPRQKLIVQWLSEGYSQPEIAEWLGHRDTNIVRYQKYIAKAKWQKLTEFM